MWTPLHFAARHWPAPGAIPYLLEISPETAKARNNHEKLPLHLACSSGKRLVDIEALVLAFLDAVECTNDKHYFPVHMACQRQASIEVVKYLVACYPEGVAVQSSDAKAPFELAIENDAPDIVIRFLGVVTSGLGELVNLPHEKRKEQLDCVLEEVLRETAKAAPEVSSDSLPSEAKADSERSTNRIDSPPAPPSRQQRMRKWLESETADDVHQPSQSAEEGTIAETPVVNASAETLSANHFPSNRNSGTAANVSSVPASRCRVAAVWARGPSKSEVPSDDNESISQASTDPPPISTRSAADTQRLLRAWPNLRLSQLEERVQATIW